MNSKNPTLLSEANKPNILPENFSFMSIMLKFIDTNIEKEYRKSLLGYQQIYLRFLQIASFVVITAAWVANSFGADHFQGRYLTINLINIFLNVILAIYFYYKKSFEYPDYALCILQLYTAIGYTEYYQYEIKSRFSNTNFVTNTIFLETVMLSSLISRCSWKINFISSLILNFYLDFRYSNGSEQPFSKIQPTLAHVMNFIFITICSYYYEKNDRTLFYKRFNDEQSLRRFEEILREVLPTSIIIFKESNILFYNVETVKTFKTDKRELLEERLRLISMEKEINIGSELNIEENRNIYENSGKSIFDHFKTLKVNFDETKKFMSLTGNYTDNFECLAEEKENSFKPNKFFDIKIGRISWKGSDAIMAILSENYTSQRLFDLQEQSRYKDRLLASVSHDLRTPLNGVIGILDLALEGDLSQSLRKSLGVALSSSNLLLFMINDILDFSQISKGTLSLNPVHFSIDEILRGSTKLQKFQAKKKGLKLIIEKKLKKNIFKSDPNRIKQVILNLLGNALKFTQKGFIKITAEDMDNNLEKEAKTTPLINKYESMGVLKFSVQDSGCGIRKKDIPKLFKLFGMLRDEENLNINKSGVGLGLAISQKLVKILNNNRDGAIINVESEHGKGSIFSFLLYPLDDKIDIDLEPKKFRDDLINKDLVPYSEESSLFYFKEGEHSSFIPKININSSNKNISLSNSIKKVLLVDDDQINILVLTKIFNTFKDFQFFTAFNGQEAVDIVREKALDKIFFNIILMDCNMPVMDGFDATVKILNMVKNGEIPSLTIIASTANSSQTDRDNCFKCGMADFISKPFTKKLLREKLDHYC